MPEDINDSGVVAGYGTEGGVVKGFVYSNGAHLILTSPDRPNTQIIGINNNMEVVGLAYNTARGFVSGMCPNLSVRIPGAVPAYYSTLRDAYDNAGGGDTIQAHDIIFSGDVNFDLDKAAAIAGGHDCEYAAVTGASRINGNIVISRGTITIGNVVIE